MSAYLSILVAVVGIVVWFVSTNAKVARAGEIAYACGLLAFLFGVAHESVKLFS